MKESIIAMLEVCKEVQKTNDNLFIEGEIHAYETMLRVLERLENKEN